MMLISECQVSKILLFSSIAKEPVGFSPVLSYIQAVLFKIGRLHPECSSLHYSVSPHAVTKAVSPTGGACRLS